MTADYRAMIARFPDDAAAGAKATFSREAGQVVPPNDLYEYIHTQSLSTYSMENRCYLLCDPICAHF